MTFDLGQPAPKRDHYGRYLLPDPGQPGATSELPWTRVTTFAKSISDNYGLGEWSERMVAKGVAIRPDLALKAAAAGTDDTGTLREVAEKAKEAAGASSGSNLGTALHSFTERADRGETVKIPAPYDQDVAAYQRALAAGGIRIVPELIERIVVVKRFHSAGTLDRAVRWDALDDPDELAIGDLKTAKGLDKPDAKGWLEIAVQEAMYANADAVWDGITETYEPMPKISRTRGLVFHLRPGSGECALWEVNLEAGWEAAELCEQVRAARKRKSLAKLIEVAGHAATPKPVSEHTPENDPVARAIADARDAAELTGLYWAAAERGEWKAVHTVLAAGRKAELATTVPAA